MVHNQKYRVLQFSNGFTKGSRQLRMQRRVGPDTVGYYGILQPLKHRQKTQTRGYSSNSRSSTNYPFIEADNDKKRIDYSSLSSHYTIDLKWYSTNILYVLPSGVIHTDLAVIADVQKIDKAYANLYNNRQSNKELKPLNITPFVSVDDYGDKKKRAAFQKVVKANGNSGIYTITCKSDPEIFYIGKSSDLINRLNNHVARSKIKKTNNRLYKFINTIGWENFTISVLEFYNTKAELTAREDYLLNEYLPLLNTKYKSDMINRPSFTYRSALKKKQEMAVDTIKTNNIFVYEYMGENCPVSSVGIYSTINNAARSVMVSEVTVTSYLNTGVPSISKSLLFFSEPLTDLNEASEKATNNLKTMPPQKKLIRPIWCYELKDGKFNLINGEPFKTTVSYLAFLGRPLTSAQWYVNTCRPDTAKGLYAFDKPITDEIVNKLIANPPKPHIGPIKIFAYSAESLDLINGEPFADKNSCARHFGLSLGASLNTHLDTNESVLLNGQLAYFFSNEITDKFKSDLLANLAPSLKKSSKGPCYAYYADSMKQISGSPFTSAYHASKVLGLTKGRIQDRIKLGPDQKPYHGYFFYNYPVARVKVKKNKKTS